MNAYIKLIANYTIADIYDDSGNAYSVAVDKSMLFFIGSKRYDNVYIWDAPEIFAIIDAYALNNNILEYENIPLNSAGYKPRITEECISRRDSDGAYFERKLWLKTQKADSIDRHKRLAATTYINIHNFFGSLNFSDSCKAFEIAKLNNEYGHGYYLKLLLTSFSDSIKEITGISILDNGGKLKYWSMGGISKAYYLKLFERYTKGIPYREYVPQNQDFEIEMRLTHLLSKGILYCNAFGVEYCNQVKYDKNSLFPNNAHHTPIFYPPMSCTWDDYIKGRENSQERIVYIITFKRLLLEVKKEYPNVLQADGEKCTDANPRILEFKNKSFFHEHFETLQKIYNIIDIEVKHVYKLKTARDPAIYEFVENLFRLKRLLNGNSARRTVVKYLLNNLHGKFAQLCLTPNYEYTTDANGLLIRRVKSLRNNWKKSHFDYIRGAYIYSMAQNEMLQELILIKHPHKISYIDTDCFITYPENAPSVISDRMGAFKIENEYKSVVFYAPKTYIGVDPLNNLKVTTAGLNASEIKQYLIFSKDYYDYATIKELNVPTTFTRRTVDGFKRVMEWRTIGDGLTTKQLEEGGYINGTDI